MQFPARFQATCDDPPDETLGTQVTSIMNAEQVQVLTDCLRMLTTNETARAASAAQGRQARMRPKAINCKTFKLGDNFPDFCVHFVECIKAAYNFALPADQDELNTACLSWIGTKLEPGPTLIAYDSLEAASKATWDALVTALTDVFSDDTEKETFLADIASFKRGNKTLIQYKNDLLRLMNTYQPDLRGVAAEFQRQVTTRFIEGLEDDSLKRELRRHCKRDKMNIEAAYLFVVDYESSDLQTRLREGEAAAFGHRTLAVLGTTAGPTTSTTAPLQTTANSSGEVRDLQEAVRNLATKGKITEMRMQELVAKSAHTNDRIDIVSKEVGQVAVNMAKLEKTIGGNFERLEQLMTQNQNAGGGQTGGNYNSGFNNRGRFTAPRGQGRGMFRGSRPVHPSITGGVGYVQNNVQPSQYRMQEPGSQIPVRPATASNGTTPIDPAEEMEGAQAKPNEIAATKAVGTEMPQGATAAAADNGIGHPRTDQGQQGYGWWSPGMPVMGVAGYDESHENTLSYGGQDFYQW